MGRLAERVKRDLKRLIYPVLILKIIVDEGGRAYGYRIARRFSEITGLKLVEGTLYPNLKELERMGLIESYWGESPSGPPRKYYVATERGKAELKDACKIVKGILEIISEICTVS